MGAQWRVECENCGKKKSDYLRMHTEIRRNRVECNLCGTVRAVDEPEGNPENERVDERLPGWDYSEKDDV